MTTRSRTQTRHRTFGERAWRHSPAVHNRQRRAEVRTRSINTQITVLQHAFNKAAHAITTFGHAATATGTRYQEALAAEFERKSAELVKEAGELGMSEDWAMESITEHRAKCGYMPWASTREAVLDEAMRAAMTGQNR